MRGDKRAPRRHPHYERFLRRRRMVLGALIAILGLSVGGFSINSSTFSFRKWFAVEAVVVEGHFDRVLPDAIVGLLGLKGGETLFSLDLGNLRRQLLAHPWLSHVRLERRYPHTLVISAIEEKPIAILAMPHYVYVNAQGLPFKEVEKGESMDFPIFVLPGKHEGVRIGAAEEKTLDEMIDFLDKYSQTRFAKRFGVSEIAVRAAEGGGWTVFPERIAMQVEFSRREFAGQLWKLDQYCDRIAVERGLPAVLDLQFKGKIVARGHLGDLGDSKNRGVQGPKSQPN